MAAYSATVARVNNADGSTTFNINILYGGKDVGVVPGSPEIVETITPLIPDAARQITHTLDQYVHDTTHLYAKATVLFNSNPAWTLEMFAQPDATTPKGHAYWASLTRIDPSAPVSITQTVN